MRAQRNAFLLSCLAIAACGGTSSSSALTGNLAFQAVAVSGYQAFRGQADAPYFALQLALPKTSPFSRSGRPEARTVNSGIAFQPELDLYFTGSQGTNLATLSFFTDAAATQSAGSLQLTGLNGTLGDYTSFPANLQGTINLTAGKLPCSGAFTITLNDAVGNNELKGNLTLPKTGVSMQFDFTLDDSGNVGGSSVITEHGSTISMTGIHGGLAADAISGNVVITPSGWTGIGNFSLATGNFSVTLATPAGTAGAELNASGGLDLTFADGTQETITDPLVADPAAPIAGSPDAGSTDAGAFTQVSLPTFAVYAKSEDGRFGGSIIGGAAVVPAYLAPGSSTPVALALGAGKVSGAVYAINVHGAMVGFVSSVALPGFQDELPAYWASPTAQPVLLTILSGDIGGEGWGINGNGQIIVNSVEPIRDLQFRPVYYASSGSAPVALSTTGLAVNPSITDGLVTGINDNGVIVGGFSYSASDGGIQYDAFAWTSPSANPTKVALPPGDTMGQIAAVNASGAMVGTTTPSFSGNILHAVTWSSPTAQPVLLTALGSDTLASPSDINNEGVIAGCSGASFRSSRPPFIQWGPEGEAVVWSAAGSHAVSQVGECGDLPLVLITGSGKIATAAGHGAGSLLLTPK